MTVTTATRLTHAVGRRRKPDGDLVQKCDNPKIPIWTPWFEHCETPYDLGFAHGKEDRVAGAETIHYHSDCLMTTEEYTDYRQGYGDGWKSEDSPMEFNDD